MFNTESFIKAEVAYRTERARQEWSPRAPRRKRADVHTGR